MKTRVGDLLRTGGIVIYTSPEATVGEAAATMARHNVGAILIMEFSGDLLGIFTERDLLKRVVVEGRLPDETPISDVMSRDVVMVTQDTPVSDVLTLMNERHCRHIPVAAGSRLLGVVSLRDLLRYMNKEREFQIEQLQEYIFQKPLPAFSV